MLKVIDRLIHLNTDQEFMLTQCYFTYKHFAPYSVSQYVFLDLVWLNCGKQRGICLSDSHKCWPWSSSSLFELQVTNLVWLTRLGSPVFYSSGVYTEACFMSPLESSEQAQSASKFAPCALASSEHQLLWTLWSHWDKKSKWIKQQQQKHPPLVHKVITIDQEARRNP